MESSEKNRDDWALLTDIQKQKIEIGLDQLDRGITKPLTEVINRLRKRYDIDA